MAKLSPCDKYHWAVVNISRLPQHWLENQKAQFNNYLIMFNQEVLKTLNIITLKLLSLNPWYTTIVLIPPVKGTSQSLARKLPYILCVCIDTRKSLIKIWQTALSKIFRSKDIKYCHCRMVQKSQTPTILKHKIIFTSFHCCMNPSPTIHGLWTPRTSYSIANKLYF